MIINFNTYTINLLKYYHVSKHHRYIISLDFEFESFLSITFAYRINNCHIFKIQILLNRNLVAK